MSPPSEASAPPPSQPSGPSEPPPGDSALPAAAPKRRRRRLTWQRKLLFGAILLGLGLLGAEGAARLFGPREPLPTLTPHPYLRHVRTPDSSMDLMNPKTGARYEVHIDGYGFRCRSLVPPGEPKPAGAYRLFFVGASTTENIAVSDEESFPQRVEVALNAAQRERSVRAVNTGIAGNTIADSFSLIAHRVTALEPDLIVLMHAINDMRASCSSAFDPTHYRDRQPPRAPRLGEVFQEHSKLLRLIELTRRRLGAASREDRYRALAAETPYSEGVDPTQGVAYFRRYLEMCADVCARAGVPLALMTQPSLYKEGLSEAERQALWMGYMNHGELNLSPAALQAGMARYNAEIRAVARERGLLLIDLERALPKDLEHLYDDCHYTAQGNARIADTISAALLAAGLPRPAPPK